MQQYQVYFTRTRDGGQFYASLDVFPVDAKTDVFCGTFDADTPEQAQSEIVAFDRANRERVQKECV